MMNNKFSFVNADNLQVVYGDDFIWLMFHKKGNPNGP